MLAISVRRFRGARLFLSGQKLSGGRGGSCGEPSAKTSTLYKDLNHVAGMMQIAEQAGKPSVAPLATFARPGARLAANVPNRIVESTLYADRRSILYYPSRAAVNLSAVAAESNLSPPCPIASMKADSCRGVIFT
jgi:hypothetical protein